MSTNTVKLCDIRDCETLATHTSLVFVHGQQKGEDSFSAWVYPNQVDLCGLHEYKYRTSLPDLELKDELSEKEIEMNSNQNPITEVL